MNKRQHKQLQKDMAEFDEACIRGEVPSGNWCRSCEDYNCGHYLDDIGGVISKSAHMRLNALSPEEIEGLKRFK